MNPFFRGFSDELAKTAGVMRGIGRMAVKNPMAALAIGTTALGTGAAALSAYRQGLRGGEKPRYLAAGVNKYTGEAEPSEAAYTNYNQLFERKPTPKKVRELSTHYRENAFKR